MTKQQSKRKCVYWVMMKFRSQDYHKRTAALVQTAGGGHDAHNILPDGLRAVCTAGVQGGAEEQVCA